MPIKITPVILFNTIPIFWFPLSLFITYEEKYATIKHHNNPVVVKVSPSLVDKDDDVPDAYSICPDCTREINLENDGGNGTASPGLFRQIAVHADLHLLYSSPPTHNVNPDQI